MRKFVLILVFLPLLACQKPEPKYVLKSEAGDAAILHWDDLKEETKYKRTRKTEIDKQIAIEKRRTARKERKGRYSKKNLWDF